MGIDNKDKIEVETLFAEGKVDDAFKKIRLIRMKCSKYIIEDEIWLNHKLAWHHYKNTKDDNMCEYYLGLNKELFEVYNEKNSRKEAYYKWLWLYTEFKKNNITLEEYSKNFIEIYQYYDLIGSERFSNGALLNIVIREGNEGKIIEFITEIINEYGTKNDFVKDVVADCKNFSNNLYIEVLKVFNTYSQTEDKVII